MPAVWNQAVAVRGPEAKRMPARSRGKRAAVRRSRQAAKRSNTCDSPGGTCDKVLAGCSGIGSGVATINLCRGPALGHSVSRESADPPKENYRVVKGFYEKVAESTITTLWAWNDGLPASDGD